MIPHIQVLMEQLLHQLSNILIKPGDLVTLHQHISQWKLILQQL